MPVSICPRCQGPIAGQQSGQYCPRCAGRLLLDSTLAEEEGRDRASMLAALRLGEYELGPELGRGAMGVVYRARQPRLKRDVAVKVILASRFAGESARKRFLAEAELAAQLDHPNIVPIYEVGETPDGPFYAMKLVEGATLSERISDLEYQISHSQDAARLLAKIARAVHHAHQRGVLHRDLKPGNILIDAQGEPHVTDFGLARQIGVESSLTVSGSPLGTPAYMAPEQARGEKGTTTASDVWSLGAILYHLLAGRPPFAGETAMEVLRKVMEEEPVPPGRLTNDDLRMTSSGSFVNRKSKIVISADLETICLKCLEKDPACRYGSALAFAEDLERWLKHEPIRARSVSPAERLVKWVRRHPAIAALVALAGVLLAAGVAGVTWQWRRADRHSETALQKTRDAMWQTNFDAAHALRTSRRMGQRVEALKAIRAAAAIRPTAELRKEAIAALALTDLEDVGSWLSHPSNVVQWAPDGRIERFAFSPQKGGVEVRRFPDGQLLATLTNGPRRLRLNYAGDGDLLLTHDRKHYRVWNTRTAELIFETPVLHEPTVERMSANLSPDGRWLAFPESRTSVVWHEIQTGRKAGRIDGLINPHALCFSPTGEFLALKSSVSSSEVIQVWRLSDRTRLRALRLKDSWELGWHASEPLLLIGSMEDSNAYVWDVVADRVQTLAGHRSDVVEASFHPDERLLASYSNDRVLRLWDPFARVQLLETTMASPHRFSADGQWLAVGSERGLGKLKVHLPQECRLFHARLGLKPGGMRFSPDGRFLVGRAPNDSWVGLWDVESGQRLAEIALDGATTAQFLGERHLVTLSREGVLLWTNLHSAGGWEPSRVRVVIPPDRGYANFVMSKNGTRLLMGRDGGIGGDVSEFNSGRMGFKLRGHGLFANPDFSVDGQWIASGYWDDAGRQRSEFCISSATNGQPVRKILMGNCAAHFSPDGRWLLAASEEEYRQFALTGHPTNWPLVRRFTRETDGILHGPAAFSGDGTLLALMADNTVVRLLESATGQELARFTPLRGVVGIKDLHLSQNGRWLVAETELGPHVWDLPLIRARLREMNLDWEGPPNLSAPKERSTPVAKPSHRGYEALTTLEPSGHTLTNTSVVTGDTLALRSRRFPSRPPESTPAQLDLTPHYSVLLTESWFELPYELRDNSLEELAPGLHELGGVTFDSRGVLQLSSRFLRSGQRAAAYPERVRDIHVGLRCQRLHFLGGAHTGFAKSGTEGARCVIHYTDGQTQEVAWRLGEQFGAWWHERNNPGAARLGEVVWRGTNEISAAHGATLQLFKWTWENPRPEVEINSLDLVSSMTPVAPFILAITAE